MSDLIPASDHPRQGRAMDAVTLLVGDLDD